MEPQLLMPCPERGCNRKYKTGDRFALHLREAHGKDAVDIDGLVAVAPKVAAKPRRTPVKRTITPPIPIPAPPRPDDADQSDCCICYEAPAGGAAPVPCGHATFCYPCLKACFERGQPCPFCRGVMTGVIKLYQ